MFPQYQLVQIIARDPQSLSDLESQLKSQASGENEREENTDTRHQLVFQFVCHFYLEPTRSTRCSRQTFAGTSLDGNRRGRQEISRVQQERRVSVLIGLTFI